MNALTFPPVLHSLSRNINQNSRVVRSSVAIREKKKVTERICMKVTWSWLIIHQTIQSLAHSANNSQKMYMDMPSVSTTIEAGKYEAIINTIFHSPCSEYLAFKIHRAFVAYCQSFGEGCPQATPLISIKEGHVSHLCVFMCLWIGSCVCQPSEYWMSGVWQHNCLNLDYSSACFLWVPQFKRICYGQTQLWPQAGTQSWSLILRP